MREQAQLAALEQPAGEKSMLQDKGWTDAEGHWTEKAPQTIRDALEKGPPSEPGEVKPEAQHAVDMANDQLRSGQTKVEGTKPGHREVPLHGEGEGHTIREVEDESGIHCELWSPGGREFRARTASAASRLQRRHVSRHNRSRPSGQPRAKRRRANRLPQRGPQRRRL